MTKSEFQECINRAEAYLERAGVPAIPGCYMGVCSALGGAVNIFAMAEFQLLFKPDDHVSGAFYWGLPSKKGLLKRQIALRLFEQYCLDEKLYKEW